MTSPSHRMPFTVIPGLMTPPDAVPDRLPVRTRDHALPFGELSWENFERLCHRLASTDANVEHSARYGLQGEAQEGIDIYARRSDGSYHCLQAKRHKSFGAAKVKAAVAIFLAGSWVDRSSKFTLVVQAGLGSTAVQEEIERQAARLKARGITFKVLDGEQLTHALRAFPVIVDDFFGRPWVEAVLGPEAAAALGVRLDGTEFSKLRHQMARVYDAQFQLFDPGSFGSVAPEETGRALTLLERFLKPDISVKETASLSERPDPALGTGDGTGGAGGPSQRRMTDLNQSNIGAERVRNRRVPLSEWLTGEERLVVMGDAGSGKSTILRAIALDLLNTNTCFPELGERWGSHVPIFISFARWAAETARAGAQVGIKEIVRLSLRPVLTLGIDDFIERAIDERRVLLLVDGLDEWNAEQAARTTLNTLITTVEAHDISVVVTGRPRGLERIGTLPAAWKRGSVAPLSNPQQAAIAATWFERHAPVSAGGSAVNGALRNKQFMAELARDTGLAVLAGTPLLLIGLVTLALRGQILPRTKIEVYDQLVRILLEVHPVSRANAAGDIQPRLRHVEDPLQRRAAIARLAFEIRQSPGGAGVAEPQARALLREYFASPLGCGLPIATAAGAAAEILSVNAETQGLLLEKAPGQIGFVHASFEEYLAAEHVAGRPFSEICDFVREHSGEARWRNVLSDLLAGLHRRDEFDRLVSVIEEPATDEVAGIQRLALLGEIAFGATTRSPATTRRLAHATFGRIEGSDYLPERQDALRTVLKGLGEPTFTSEIGKRIGNWAPARSTYLYPLVTQLGQWKSSPTLSDALLRALHDEDDGMRRAAAKAYARAFAGSADAMSVLVKCLAASRNLDASVAMLEALVLGWPTDAETTALADDAVSSASAELRLLGSFGRAESGRATDADRWVAFRAQLFWSDVSHSYRAMAGEMLLKYWPNDDELMAGALARASGDFKSPWEYDLAFSYVLDCSTDRPEIRSFIKRELGKERPFNVMHWGRVWSDVGRFALLDPDIRAAANAHWADPKHRIIGMHKLADYAEVVPDDEIATILLEGLRGDRSMDRYWSLDALLRGWGREHPLVGSAISELLALPDERLLDLVALLPKIIADPGEARDRVLSVAKQSDVRRDMLATALEALGCDYRDDEAVDAILSDGDYGRAAYDHVDVLFRTFAKHPRVRALALSRLGGLEPPLSSLARGYGDDPEIAATLLGIATPLPTELRSLMVEAATTGSAGTTLESLLENGPLEADADLRIRMTTTRLGSLTDPAVIDRAKDELLLEMNAVGSDHSVRRSVALAGLITLGHLTPIVDMPDYNGRLQLEAGGWFDKTPSLERLICEKYDLLLDAFGEELAGRFANGDHGSRLNEILASSPSASPAARAAFLRSAESGTMPPTPAALRSLAAERPRSGLLLDRCMQALAKPPGDNNGAMVCGEIALILAAEFPTDQSLLARLEEAYVRAPFEPNAVALAVYAPHSEALPLPRHPDEIHDFGAWTAAMHAVGARADADTFTTFLDAMILRSGHTQFDAQRITNMAVVRRVQCDVDVEDRLVKRLGEDAHPSVIGSYARYLAASGRLGTQVRSTIGDVLADATRVQRLVTAGYDAIGDRWRALRATLLDALRADID